MRIGMIVTSGVSYWINGVYNKGKYGEAAKFNFEHPLTSRWWLTSVVSILMTYLLSYLLIPTLGDGTLWWKLSTIITCGTLAGAVIPELVKVFTSTNSGHVKEVVTASREGGASLNIISGLVAGNFSAYWMGMAIIILMAVAYAVSTTGLADIMAAPAIFAFGLVAFGFLGMGPVTIAVDSYGPVTDNAQSVYELSTIETLPNIKQDIQKQFGFEPDFENAKTYLEENDGAGNTFKATAKPVLIGTAVVGATTLIFSIIQVLAATYGTTGPQGIYEGAFDPEPLFLLGLVTGGAVIYCSPAPRGRRFPPAPTGGGVHQAEHQAGGRRREGLRFDSKRSSRSARSTRRRDVHIFWPSSSARWRSPAAPLLFIGYLISIAISVSTGDLHGGRGRRLGQREEDRRDRAEHEGDGAPRRDRRGATPSATRSRTLLGRHEPDHQVHALFGLLAVELAITLDPSLSRFLALAFFLASTVFVYRSFYGMRIKSE